MVTQEQIDDRMYPDVPRVGVGMVILLNGQLLLVRRKKEPAKNLWTLPGGLIELGESTIEAAIRETREETGLEVEVDSVLDVVDYIEKDEQGNIRIHYVIIDYLGYVVSGKLEPGSDVSEVKLVQESELSTLELPPITEAFLKKHARKIFGAL